MDANQKAALEAAGINVKGALDRFMGNEKMLEKYLNRFLAEKSYAALTEAVKNDDQAGAAAAVHTLKSVCGTIGCDAMHDLVVEQEKEMRAGNWQQALAMMPKIEESYNNICKVLQSVL